MTHIDKKSEAQSALPPVDGLEVVLEKICHKEQIGIWANEITSALALSDFLREEWTFDDSVDLEKEIAAQLRDIITSAFTHPGLDLVAALSQASSVIAGLKAEIADLRDEWQAEYDARLAANTARRAAEARIASLEQANEALMRERTSLIETKREQVGRLAKERDETQTNVASLTKQTKVLFAKLSTGVCDQPERISSLEEENKRLRDALDRAMDWIGAAPHDDHCFTNDPNPDACRCVCGKDTLLDTLGDHNG